MNIVSLGGVTVGLCILGFVLTRWWKRDKRKIPLIMPFVFAAFYGMLLILSAGGLLGITADVALWGTNRAGDAALEYGVGGGTPEVTRRFNLALSDGGHAMVLVLTAIVVALQLYGARKARWDIGLGALTGVSLGLAGGVAGWAAMALAPVVNTGGDAIVGLL